MSEWISVEDRLPEEAGDYLVCGEGVIVAWRQDVAYYDLEFWHSSHVVVEYWQPLPQSPEVNHDTTR